AFLLTSCLSTASSQDYTSPPIQTASPSNGHLDPRALKREQQRLQNLSVNEIIDQFFSPRSLLISDAQAQVIITDTTSSSTITFSGGPVCGNNITEPPEACDDGKNGDN